MMTAVADPGSFRDPSGQVFIENARVLRTVSASGAEDFEFVRATGVIDELVTDELVLPGTVLSESPLPAIHSAGVRYVVEHPKIPFISYPYEWCFSALKAAALCHLDVHLRALERGVALSDSSAYNIQFQGARPIFIDYLSFRRYRDGELWAGHQQFCEQFLNPLLLRSILGLPHNAWYRGTQEGIPVAELNRIVPWHHKLGWRMLTHVVLQARFQTRAVDDKGESGSKRLQGARLPLAGLQGMLRGLRRWIARLTPADAGRRTVWGDYTRTTSYSADEAQAKEAFVRAFVEAARPAVLWDVGCNTGEFAEVALAAGAGTVIGFDLDHGAVEAAFARARDRRLALLPLCLDLANPSPSQGWEERERQGLATRGPADAMIALALVHHLAIGRNIPLDRLVGRLVDMAPRGVIEFVPKADPMVGKLLRLREDIFPDYTEDAFLAALGSRARVEKTTHISQSGRLLAAYSRK